MKDISYPLERPSFWKDILHTINDAIYNFVDSFRHTQTLQVVIPSNIYLRTKLICEYISDKMNVSFTLPQFLMLLYLDFIEHSITEYNPLNLYCQIQPMLKEEYLIIHDKERYIRYETPKPTMTEIVFTMDKTDIEKGQLLLDELEDLYGQVPTLEEMLANLWIHFIEEYKQGNPKHALNEIIEMIKRNLHQIKNEE